MRRDAKLRRDTLVQAAADLFEEEGHDVPLEIIAEKAGIGRGTLYRNFRDRSQLALEVMRMRLDELAAEIERNGDDPDAFIPFLARVGLLSALNASDCGMEMDSSLAEEREAIEERAKQLFAIPLKYAQAAGNIRHDVTVADVSRIAKMLQAIAVSAPLEQRPQAVSEALNLIIEGIASRS